MKICFAKVSAVTLSVQVYNLTELKILFSVENSKPNVSMNHLPRDTKFLQKAFFVNWGFFMFCGN